MSNYYEDTGWSSAYTKVMKHQSRPTSPAISLSRCWLAVFVALFEKLENCEKFEVKLRAIRPTNFFPAKIFSVFCLSFGEHSTKNKKKSWKANTQVG